MSEEKMLLMDVHSVPAQQDKSFSITRWANLPMQIYPRGYVSTDRNLCSLFDVADYRYTAPDAGLCQMAKDILRNNIIFMDEPSFYNEKGEPLLLKDKVAAGNINIELLKEPLLKKEEEIKEEWGAQETEEEFEKRREELWDKKKKELEKIESLLPMHLHPKLRHFFLYNLHQNSLVSSPAKILLTNILIEHYTSVIVGQEPYCNPWTTLVRVAADGKSFSITNTQLVDYYRELKDRNEFHFIDPTEVSSTHSFGIDENEEIQARCDEFSIQSSDTKMVQKFEEKMSEALANQAKVIYKPKEIVATSVTAPISENKETVPVVAIPIPSPNIENNEADLKDCVEDAEKCYQEARDYYEACLTTYRDHVVKPALENNKHQVFELNDNPVIASGFAFLEAADFAVQQNDAAKQSLMTLFEFQARRLADCMPRRVKRPEKPKSLTASHTEEECLRAIEDLDNHGEKNLATKARTAVGTLLKVAAVMITGLVLSAIFLPAGYAFVSIVTPNVITETEAAIDTFKYVAKTAIGLGLKEHAAGAMNATLAVPKIEKSNRPRIQKVKSVPDLDLKVSASPDALLRMPKKSIATAAIISEKSPRTLKSS